MAKFVKVQSHVPSFCIIAPTAYLSLTTKSKTHLVLAHIVDKDELYANFYLQRAKLGDQIIMDNGAFELGCSYDPDKLFGLAEKCGAHAIVLPDYPFRPIKETIAAAKIYAPIFKEAGFQTFFVPQSEKGDFHDVEFGYRWAADHPDIDIIGMSILTFPNALPNIHPTVARIVGTTKLIEHKVFNFNKWHHYLGLIDAAIEIPTLMRMGVVDSLDSSNPVWAGCCGYEYNKRGVSFLPVAKEHLPEVNFSVEYDADNESVAEANVDVVLDMFNNPNNYR